MKNFDEVLNAAIEELRKGTPKDVILSKWPEYELELSESLMVAKTFNALPRKKIPAPTMQRKYLTVPIKQSMWFAWLHFSRFTAVSMASLLLIAGSVTTAYGAFQSLPGQTLFPIKKTAERIQLHFTSNEIERANLQIKITKERLADAQTVFNREGTSSEQKLAALNELTSQTNATLQTVKFATNSSSQNNSPIAASLQDITSQQQALLNKIDSQPKVATTQNTSEAVKQFRNMIAATNEQASVIALAPDTNATVISGTITNFGFGTVTIDKTGISLATSTVFKINGSLATTSAVFSLNQHAIVIADKHPNSTELTAREILISSQDPDILPAVKGTSTTTPDNQNTASSSTSSAASIKKMNPSNSKATDTPESSIAPGEDQEATPDDGKAVGTFIPEDPAPQFNH